MRLGVLAVDFKDSRSVENVTDVFLGFKELRGPPGIDVVSGGLYLLAKLCLVPVEMDPDTEEVSCMPCVVYAKKAIAVDNVGDVDTFEIVVRVV